MSRHPWTYADDFVRGLGPVTSDGVVLSRADACLIIHGIAAAIGMAQEELAIKLSEAEQAKTEADREAECRRLMCALGMPAQRSKANKEGDSHDQP